MSGTLGDLTPEQEDKLKEFRAAVQDILRPDDDDNFLLEWLRARDFNLKATETMLRKSLQWRKAMGLDEIPPQEFVFLEVITKYDIARVVGYDKEGCPFWILTGGNLDLKGMCYSVRKFDMVKYVAVQLDIVQEDMKRQSKKLGKLIETQSGLIDLENYSIKQISSKAALDVLLEFVKLYEANYPEMLKKVFVINCPVFLPMLFSLIKTILSEKTTSKIKFYGANDMSWKDEVFAMIDPEVIPQYWGGTRVGANGDPKCPELVRFGGAVPKSYYFQYRRLSEVMEKNMKTAVINRKSTFEVELIIDEPSSAIHWKFITEDYDISFGVIRKEKVQNANQDDGDNMTANPHEEVTCLIPVQRVNSHLVPEDGKILCDIAGKYILIFDNSYSFYRSKKISYDIRVETST